MSPSFVTNRLAMAPFECHEAAELHALWTRPEVRRYLWDDEIIPAELTAEILEKNQWLFATEEYGLWSVRELGSPVLLGFAGFWHFREPPELEIILGFAADVWGRGYAQESGRALIDYAFQKLGFIEVRGSCDAPNQRSRRMMERLDMTLERQEVVGGLDTVFYRIARNESEI